MMNIKSGGSTEYMVTTGCSTSAEVGPNSNCLAFYVMFVLDMILKV